MALSPHYALMKAIRARATASGELWGTRVYRGQAPANAVLPYLVVMFPSSVKPQKTRTRDARTVVTFRCVANDAVISESGAARIIELFDDIGQSRAETLATEPDWKLIKSQIRQYISLTENVNDGAAQLYHDGAMIEFDLEALT